MSEGPTDRGVAVSIGPLTFAAWREEALARAMRMEHLLNWLEERSEDKYKDFLVDAIRRHLRDARESAHTRGRLRSAISGSAVERTLASLDAAQVNLLRLAPSEYLRSNVPSLFAEAREQLDENDLRLIRLKNLASEADEDRPPLTESERSVVIAAIESAMEQARRRQTRVRSFRNVIWFTSAAILTLCIISAIIGFFSPGTLPLCFLPESGGQVVIICPSGRSATVVSPGFGTSPSDIDEITRHQSAPSDIALVEFVGLLGASVAAARAVRGIRGTGDPYSLPVALAVLKLPTGALLAFLAILLIRAQFVPGLSALDSSAQIIAWSLIFGYSQQLFTRVVDNQAALVLEQGDYSTGPKRSTISEGAS